MRLSRRLCLNAPDHRLPPTLTPHRFTTASMPASPAGSNSPLSGFQCNSSAVDGARRTMRSTRWSLARSADINAEPISPEEPAIAIAAVVTGLQPQVGLERSFFEPPLDGGQEAAGVCTVDQAMVVGQGQVADRPDADRLVAVAVDDHP